MKQSSICLTEHSPGYTSHKLSFVIHIDVYVQDKAVTLKGLTFIIIVDIFVVLLLTIDQPLKSQAALLEKLVRFGQSWRYVTSDIFKSPQLDSGLVRFNMPWSIVSIVSVS